MLTRDSILAQSDLPKVKVEVPEWGGVLWVRSMTGSERDAFEADAYLLQKQYGEGIGAIRNLRARLVVATACDESGQLLFTKADADAVGGKNAHALDRVFQASQRLNGMSDTAVESMVGESNAGRS